MWQNAANLGDAGLRRLGQTQRGVMLDAAMRAGESGANKRGILDATISARGNHYHTAQMLGLTPLMAALSAAGGYVSPDLAYDSGEEATSKLQENRLFRALGLGAAAIPAMLPGRFLAGGSGMRRKDQFRHNLGVGLMIGGGLSPGLLSVIAADMDRRRRKALEQSLELDEP